MVYVTGLGNPGRKYRDTRHNIGYRVVDRLARLRQIRWSAGKGDYLYGRDRDPEYTLVKPLTYMNHSGRAVRQLIDFVKGDYRDVLIVYDDLDLPLGRMRFRPEGGPGTHKGIRSVIQAAGTEEIPRLRLGIGSSLQKGPAEDFVLKPFARKEKPVVEEVVNVAVEGILKYITDGMEATMNQYNTLEVEHD